MIFFCRVFKTVNSPPHATMPGCPCIIPDDAAGCDDIKRGTTIPDQLGVKELIFPTNSWVLNPEKLLKNLLSRRKPLVLHFLFLSTL